MSECPFCGAETPVPVTQAALTFHALRENETAPVPAFTIRPSPDEHGRRFFLGPGFEPDTAARAFAEAVNDLLRDITP